MLKIEHKLLPKTGVVAIAIEAQRDSDLQELDLIVATLSQAFKQGFTEGAYFNSKRYILHVKGMPKELLEKLGEEPGSNYA
jgi:hypothetical protein